MMMELLGHADRGRRVLAAVEKAVTGHRAELTPDIGGRGTTSSVGNFVARLLEPAG